MVILDIRETVPPEVKQGEERDSIFCVLLCVCVFFFVPKSA